MDSKNKSLIINAINDIFDELYIEIENIEISDNLDVFSEIIANIGITGRLKGNLIVASDIKSAKNITKKLLDSSFIKHKENSFDEIDKAAFAELANQLSGRVVMNFAEHNIDCTITPPTIITGNNVKTLLYGLTEFFYSNIIGQFGYINLLFGIK